MSEHDLECFSLYGMGFLCGLSIFSSALYGAGALGLLVGWMSRHNYTEWLALLP